ncbi:MAG: phage portal protein [Clostridia bacterium]|nr:phage portal protein [Clostridia bacterium]
MNIGEMVKGVWTRMGRGKEELSVFGVRSVVSDKEKEAMSLWQDIYTGKAPWLYGRVKSLALAGAVSSEIARMATIEMKARVSGGKRAQFLDDAFQVVIGDIRRQVEYGCALSGLIFKPYVKDGKILVSCLLPDSFYPTAWDSAGRITAAVFVDTVEEGDKIFRRLEYHKMGDSYRVENRAFVSGRREILGREIALSDVPQWADIEPLVELSGVKTPLFGYFRYPGANDIVPGSPLGVSCFARAVDLMAEADKQYSRLLWEFESGERALYVSESAFRRDKSGKPVLPDSRLYRALDVEMGEKDLFSDWSPVMRDESILRGLNAILRKIEYSCGIAYGSLSDVQESNKTAEEVRASAQRSYATVCDVQNALRTALAGLVAAMDVLASLYRLAPEGDYELSFEFDDSIAADRKTEFNEKRQLVADGIMAPWEFRMWYFGETEEMAKSLQGRLNEE